MIKWTIISIICLVILGNLGIDAKKVIDSKTAQSNIQYAKNIISFVWDKYLEQPVKFLWNDIFVKYIWSYTKNFLDTKFKGNEIELNKEKISIGQPVLFSYFSRV
jgi:hypothetical protein